MGKRIQFPHCLIVLLSVLFINQHSQAQKFDWAKQAGEYGWDYGYGISVDANGNSYVTGSFTVTATFGSVQLTSAGGADIFIAKYDNNGNCLWAKQAGGSEYDYSAGISVDANGNSYVTGHFTGTATFGSVQLTSAGPYGSLDIFIAKYDNNGNCLWAKQAGGSGEASGNGISVDANGNSYVTGYFTETATFGSVQLTSAGYYDIFIAKYDNNGNCLWAKQAGGSIIDYGNGISVDANGNSYVTGFFCHTTMFGSVQLTSAGPYGFADIFIAKYDNNGNCLWVKQAGGSTRDSGNGISVDANGNSYVTGTFSENAAFGSVKLTRAGPSGSEDIFIAKYDNNGNCLWAKQAGGSTRDSGNGISVDANGDSYVTGYFSGTATFGSVQLTYAGYYDIFIAKYDNNGNCLWAKQAGGPEEDSGYGISVDANGNSYVTGFFSGTAMFGSVQFTSVSHSRDILIAKLVLPRLILTSPNGNEIWQTNTIHNITWNSEDDGNIKIEITTDNGTNWITLVNSVSASLGNYTFTVPPFPSSSGCKIRLTSLSYGNTSQSTSAFTITSDNVPALYVTLPNTSIKWNSNSQHNITWSMNGIVENAKLEYTTNNGSSWNVITNSTPAASLSYTWTIPNSPSASCRIRISDASNSSLNDVSDNLFSIAQITITSPNGEEIWKAGSSKNITWASTAVSYVKISYSTDNGSSWNVITHSTSASAQSLRWAVPSLTSSNCKIKVENGPDPTLFDISDNTFTIWRPAVSSFTPTTGQITQTFGSTNIDFSAFVVVADAITVTHYPFVAPVSGTLPSGIVDISPYYWTISSPSISFINGAIEVPISALPGLSDTSKLFWLKREKLGDAWTNIGGIVSNSKLQSTVPFNSFSEFAIGSTGSITPVELKSFQVVPNNDQIVLNWQTTTETNNYGFEVEKCQSSGESKTSNYGPWQKIGFVKGNGSTTTPNEYTFIDRQTFGFALKYRLKQVDLDGKYNYSPEVEIKNDVPVKYALKQNYPNPFNPSTVINYSLPVSSEVTLKVFDILGKEVATLVRGIQAAGRHSITFNTQNHVLPSGIYVYKIQAGSFMETKKMLLLK